MDLLDRFRRQTPRWEDPDPAVRAEGVRTEVHADDQPLLERIASEDVDPKVRRAAVGKLARVEALAAAVRDGDPGVRETATDLLLARALGGSVADAAVAVGALTETRHLMTVARTAALAAARQGALARLTDPRSVAMLARTAEDAAVRTEAMRRVEDPALVAEIAARSEHKGTAVAAVDRTEDVEALRAIAARAANKAASRRAQSKLDVLFPPPAPAPPEPEAEPEPEPEPLPAPARAEPVEALAPAVPAPEPEPEAVLEAPAAADETLVVGAAAEQAAVDPAAQEAARDAAEKRAADAKARREHLERAEALCARLAELAKVEGLVLKDAEASLREARTALATALPPRLEQKVKAARAALFARAQELREADEWSRWANAAIQEELCQRLEGLLAGARISTRSRSRFARPMRGGPRRAWPRGTRPRPCAIAIRRRGLP